MTDEPLNLAAIRRLAEGAIKGRADFEAHVRRSTKPLRIELDPRDVIALLDARDRLAAELAAAQGDRCELAEDARLRAEKAESDLAAARERERQVRDLLSDTQAVKFLASGIHGRAVPDVSLVAALSDKASADV